MKKTLLAFVVVLLSVTESFPQASFITGALEVSVNEYGRIRLFDMDENRHLQRASILVGTSPTTVFDYQNDAEQLEPTVLVSNPASSDFEIYGAYDNSYSSAPPDVIVRLNAFGWNNGNYAIVKFTVINDETNPINATIGLDIIPELNMEYGYDTVTYNSALQLIRFHRGSQMNMGIKLLTASLSSLYSFEWYDGYEVDADYWTWMNHGSLQSQYVSNTVDGPVTITAEAPITLAHGQYYQVYYALALGANEAAMLANIAAAEAKFNGIFVGVEENELSGQFDATSFPNPFNTSTTISYQLQDAGFVTLKVFDACGREIKTLVNENQPVGLHKVNFSANGLPEGVYYYTLTSDNQVVTHKMVIAR